MPFFSKRSLTVFFCFFTWLFSCSPEPKSSTVEVTADPLFTLLSPEESKIDFQNTIEEGLNTNILMYEYFYNGGGVAVGDINQDGLEDLYFTANLVPNKLYLNKGNLQFQEITQEAGVAGRPGPWTTGTAMADVNGDGLLDIYVSYSGAMPPDKRTNQLFINQGPNDQGIPTFTEQAAQYGLASTGFSNQVYFFDADQDGDLDVLLLNHNPKNLPILNEVKTAEFLKIEEPNMGIRLFKQDQGTFKDATLASGISSSPLTYGLSIGISDFNRDGWPDFYVSNDYAVPDYLYINQQDGTFKNELPNAIGHNSHFSMGNDVADINNDGWADIFTLDMLPEDNRRQKLLMAPDNYAKFDLNVRSGFHYQYMRNMLQLNNGDGSFSEIGQLAGVSNTDWSWAALLADYDNDGWKDLYITNGYLRDFTNLDFINYMNDFVAQKGRLQREDVLDIIKEMPASNIKNYAFHNQEGTRFENNTESWGLAEVSNSNGAVYADLDNDGDLELIVNNINKPVFIFRNEANTQSDNHYLQVELRGEGTNTYGIGAKVSIQVGDQIQSLEQMPMRGYLSSVSYRLHFGLGKKTQVDQLTIHWPSGKEQVLENVPADQLLKLDAKNASNAKALNAKTKALFEKTDSPLAYQQPTLNINDFDRQPLLMQSYSHLGPVMAAADLNGDQLEDLVIGAGVAQPTSLWIQQKDGGFSQENVADFLADQAHEDGAIAVFDANGDGAPDIYIASAGYHNFTEDDPILQDRLYLNNGNGNFSRKGDALPTIQSNTATVAASDINGDGSLDLFVGGRVVPGRYPESPRSYILINDGKGNFSDQTEALAPELLRPGMVTSAVWADLNQDERPELILAGEWMPIMVFENQAGKLSEVTENYFDRPYRGLWNQITIADFNQDQIPDLLVGNIGTNTQFQASVEHPLSLYYKDFDANGSIDPVFCYYIDGENYPYVTRDELLRQLSGLRQRFRNYESYADVSITELFSSSELKNADLLQVDEIKTSLFLSASDGKYTWAALPIESQYAPVCQSLVFDADADGNDDILLCGNNSNMKLRLGKMDANHGVLLKGNGRGQFFYLPQQVSGFNIQGDVRSILQLNDQLVFGIHQGKMVAYERIQ